MVTKSLSIHHVVSPEPPFSARLSTGMWFLAIGAGAAETVVAAVGAIGSMPWSALVAQVALRIVLYGGLFVVIDRYFRQGHRWSRTLLAVLLGGVGLATLLVGPVEWLVTNGNFSQLEFSLGSLTFAAIRCVHIMAVVAAVALMYQPDANLWFRRKPTHG